MVNALDWAVEQSLSNELITILDSMSLELWADPMGNKERSSLRGTDGRSYKDYPDEIIFEILNEPNKELTPELWNQFHSEALL